MKRLMQIMVFVSLIALTVVLLNHIVIIRLLEMQFQIQTDSFINFDLSSRLLVFRMKDLMEQRTDMRDELSGSVLETKVINELNKDLQSLTLMDQFTLTGMNGVRIMVLKSPLHLETGRAALKTLQVAFYFERTKHYTTAMRIYQSAMNDHKLTSDARAFAMLHLGFCHVVVGNLEESLRLLTDVRSNHANTHFGDTADIIIRMILQGDRDVAGIESSGESDLAKARKLAGIGRCPLALRYYAKSKIETDADRYAWADCLERTGKIKEAMVGYKELIQGSTGSELKEKATRRLLIVGEFYGGGDSARRFAAETLAANGDLEALALMEEAQKDRKDDTPTNGDTGILQKSVQDDLKSVEADEHASKELFPASEKKVVSKSQPVYIPAPVQDNYDILIETFSGRRMRMHSTVVAASQIGGESGTMQIAIPVSEARRISPLEAGQVIKVILRDGRSFRATELIAKSDTGFVDPSSNTIFPYGDVVRIIGERQ